MIITTGEKWLTVCVIYDVFICVTSRNKHPILIAKQSLVISKLENSVTSFYLCPSL